MAKLDRLKKLLGIAGSEQDEVLSMYLDFAKDEILSWLYSGKKPAGVTDVPTQYEATQIMACVAGFSMQVRKDKYHTGKRYITLMEI